MKLQNTSLLLLFVSININAQFVGYYNLHDGGMDISSSSLFILPNNKFKIFTGEGFKNGTWKEVNKDKIILTETKTNTSPFCVFGKEETKTSSISIDVDGLVTSHALVNFSRDSLSDKQYQPLFNVGANCFGNDYHITKKKNEFNEITFTTSVNSEIGRRLKMRYPYKAVSYTFPLDKKHSNFTIIFDEVALRKAFEFTLSKKGNVYSYGGEKELEREELTDEILKKIEEAEIAEANEILRHNYGEPVYQKSTSELIINKKSSLKPIFESFCENDKKDEPEETDTEELPKELTAIDRENGFYTVTNFDGEYESSEYKYAKEASISKKDVLSVNKVISDDGGYEIEFIFSESGTLKFKEFIERNDSLGKPIAIIINNFIISTYFSFYSFDKNGTGVTGNGLSENQIDEFIVDFKK